MEPLTSILEWLGKRTVKLRQAILLNAEKPPIAARFFIFNGDLSEYRTTRRQAEFRAVNRCLFAL